MKPFRSYVLIASIAIFTSTAAFSLSTPAVKEGDKKVTTTPPANPVEKGKGSATAVEKGKTPPVPVDGHGSKKMAKKEGHKGKRGEGHNPGPKKEETEAAPGERLTIRQVVVLLKTTRNFSGKNLSGLRLAAFDLSRCNLKGADLSNANLERADLEESILERADLSGANLKMTDLRLTGLKGIKFERATLDGAIWQDGTVCAKGSIGLCRDHPDRFGSN